MGGAWDRFTRGPRHSNSAWWMEFWARFARIYFAAAFVLFGAFLVWQVLS